MTAITQRILSKTTSILKNYQTRNYPFILNWIRGTTLTVSDEFSCFN